MKKVVPVTENIDRKNMDKGGKPSLNLCICIWKMRWEIVSFSPSQGQCCTRTACTLMITLSRVSINFLLSCDFHELYQIIENSFWNLLYKRKSYFYNCMYLECYFFAENTSKRVVLITLYTICILRKPIKYDKTQYWFLKTHQQSYFYWNSTVTNSISGRALVLTGGHQVPTQGDTKICVCHFFLYPTGSSKSRLTMRLRGQSWPLWVWPENCISTPFFWASESFFGWWSRSIITFFLSTHARISHNSFLCLPNLIDEMSSRPAMMRPATSIVSSCNIWIPCSRRYARARSIPPMYSWFPVIPNTP